MGTFFIFLMTKQFFYVCTVELNWKPTNNLEWGKKRMDPGVPNSWSVLGFFGVFGYQNLLVYGHMWTKRHSDMTLRENTTNRRMTRQKLAFGLVVASLRWKLFSLWNTWGFWVCEKHEILCSRIRLDSVLWQNILLFHSWSSYSHSCDQFILSFSTDDSRGKFSKKTVLLRNVCTIRLNP